MSERHAEYKAETKKADFKSLLQQRFELLKNNKIFLIGLISIAVLMLVMLVAPKESFNKSSSALSTDAAEAIQRLERVLPGTQIVTVNPSPIEGLLEVITGEQVLYLAQDRYLVIGHIYDLKEARDLTQERKASVKLPSFGQGNAQARQQGGQQAPQARQQEAEPKLAASISKDEIAPAFEAISSLAVKYGPEDAPKLYVFSDPQCGFCQRLHQELYGRDDIQVVELMYPIFPGSDVKSAQVLCSTEDIKPDALTKVMNGQEIAYDPTCIDEAIKALEASRNLGRALNVTGTPTMFAEDGRGRAGYLPAHDLLNWLGGN